MTLAALHASHAIDIIFCVEMLVSPTGDIPPRSIASGMQYCRYSRGYRWYFATMLRKMEVLLRFSGLKVLRCHDENVRRGQIDKRYKIAWTLDSGQGSPMDFRIWPVVPTKRGVITSSIPSSSP